MRAVRVLAVGLGVAGSITGYFVACAYASQGSAPAIAVVTLYAAVPIGWVLTSGGTRWPWGGR